MKKSVTIIIIITIIFSCNNNQNEDRNINKIDTIIVSDSDNEIFEEKILIENVDKVENETEENTLTEELETILELNNESIIGIWVCNSHKAFELYDNFKFKSHNHSDEGTWEIIDNKLIIYLYNDTVKMSVYEISNHNMIISKIDFKIHHHFICFTELDYDKIYSEFYKDRPVNRNIKEAFVGKWESGGEIITFNNDGSFDFLGEDGGEGYWDYINRTLIINYDEGRKIESDDFLLTTERFAFSKDFPYYRVHDNNLLLQSPLID